MIIKKNEDGTYLCESNGTYYTISSKSDYESQKVDIESLPEPTNEELIELGKSISPYYQKDNSLVNINAQLAEIEEFENGDNSL